MDKSLKAQQSMNVFILIDLFQCFFPHYVLSTAVARSALLYCPHPFVLTCFSSKPFSSPPLIIGPYTWKQKNTPGYSPLPPPPLTQKTPLITMLMYFRVTLYKYITGTPAGIPLWVHRCTRTTSPLLGDDPVEVYSQHDFLPNIKVN